LTFSVNATVFFSVGSPAMKLSKETCDLKRLSAAAAATGTVSAMACEGYAGPSIDELQFIPTEQIRKFARKKQ
jgi:predicted aconitase